MKLEELISRIEGYHPDREVRLTLHGKPLEIHSISKTFDPYELVLELSEVKTDPQGIHPNWRIDKAAKKTQKQAIKEWLLAGNTITPLEALEMYGCSRLATRIFELKREGMKIDSLDFRNERTGKHYAQYRLATEKQE